MSQSILPVRAAYLWHILGDSIAPGRAAWQQSAAALQSVLNESINLFYINIGLAAVNLSPLPSVASHPVSEVRWQQDSSMCTA